MVAGVPEQFSMDALALKMPPDTRAELINGVVLMPTPVGPVPRDPDDPDLWDWGEDDDAPAARRRPLRALVAGLLVLSLILLLVISVL